MVFIKFSFNEELAECLGWGNRAEGLEVACGKGGPKR